MIFETSLTKHILNGALNFVATEGDTPILTIIFSQSRAHVVALSSKSINCLPTMSDFEPDLDDVKLGNVIGLLMIMKEIREQKPLDDPDALGIDDKGRPYY